MSGMILDTTYRPESAMDQRQRQLPPLGPDTSVHFVGIGGIGMSGLARLCLDRGCRVTGADDKSNDQTRALIALGASISTGAHPELVEGTDIVVYSSAVPVTHSERRRAEELGIPALRRGSFLAHLVSDLRLLGVAGSHGKTTTSSLLALGVRAAGLDPTIILGGDLPALGGNALTGTDPYCVAETDESDGSFLELKPYVALVTNVDDDHLEHYGNIHVLRDAFRDYLSLAAPERRIICADCRHLYTLARRAFGRDFLTYGFAEDADIRGSEIELASGGSQCRVHYGPHELGRLTTRVPGMHVLSNALGAVATGTALGLDPVRLMEGLSNYRGTRRRFEQVGDWRGARLIDDYGHHPTEIQATLQAMRQFTEGRCVVVFQPHRYSRTDQLFEEFTTAFGGVDVLVLAEIYSAGEAPRPGVSSKRLLPRIQGVGRSVYAPTLADVESSLKDIVKENDTVLFLGAGDINQVAFRLLKSGE